MKNVQTYQNKDTNRPGSASETSQVDSELGKKVYEALHHACLLETQKITVRVFHRTVYLEGIVDSEKSRDMACEAVLNIFGVRNVVNYLTFPWPLSDVEHCFQQQK